MVKKLLVGLTGRHQKDWQDKLGEINRLKIKEIGLFLEAFPVNERQGLLPALLNSSVKTIPLVHLRDDSTHQEIELLYKKFGCRHFTIHENHFAKKTISRWRGYYKNLYLEMNTDDNVKPMVKVEKIGGFCVDLAHYKREVARQKQEYIYIVEHLKKTPCACNHLSGYSYRRNKDLHWINRVSEFNYLTTLPHNLFGQIMAIEVFNSIADQLKYSQALKILLQPYLKCQIINN